MKTPVALCLGCNYDLCGLAESRCPECGRSFDPTDPTTYNRDRPLNWLDRKLLQPIGMPDVGVSALPCVAMLYLSLSSDIYYMGGYIMLLVLMCVAMGAVLSVRLALRRIVPPPHVPRPNDRKHMKLLVVIAAATCVLVFAKAPLRAAFLYARPELDQLVLEIRAGKVNTPVSAHRAGPFLVSSSRWYGKDREFFLDYKILGLHGGLAHCPDAEPSYYNRGTDGALGGDWYWWTDD